MKPVQFSEFAAYPAVGKFMNAEAALLFVHP
jgi:hypothetical protein